MHTAIATLSDRRDRRDRETLPQPVEDFDHDIACIRRDLARHPVRIDMSHRDTAGTVLAALTVATVLGFAVAYAFTIWGPG